MKRPIITVIGSNMVDLVTRIDRMPSTGETINGLDFEMGFGGKGANQAVACALMGAEVSIITAVGDDMFGPRTLENLRSFGIDASAAKTVESVPSGVAPIFVDTRGDNRILIVKGANERLEPDDLRAAEHRIAGSDMVVLQWEIRPDTVYAAVDLCRAKGVPVLLNPAPADGLLELDRILGVDFLVPNETELETLTGLPTASVSQAETAARTLVDRGIRRVIATLGENGALLITEDGAEHLPPIPVRAVDTTGAGDAFIGSFAAAYAGTGDVLGAMALANRFAGLSTERSGTQKSFPRREELENDRRTP